MLIALSRVVLYENGTSNKPQTVSNKILSDLHVSKEPIFITENGRPSAYLLDIENYQAMQDRLKILEGISRGEIGYL